MKVLYINICIRLCRYTIVNAINYYVIIDYKCNYTLINKLIQSIKKISLNL